MDLDSQGTDNQTEDGVLEADAETTKGEENMKLGEMFELIVTGSHESGKGTMGLLKAVFSYNAEQSEARTEVFCQTCVRVMRNNTDKYPAIVRESFPEYTEDVKDASTWFMGGYEVWQKAFPDYNKFLMEEEVI